MELLGKITAMVFLGVGITGIMYGIVKLMGIFFDGVDASDEATHHYMTKCGCTQCAYGTFEQFLAEFNKREWERDKNNPESFFGKDQVYPRPDHIHASIIRFSGVGMLLRGEDYKKFVKWEKEHSLERREDAIPLWEDIKKEEV